MAVKMSAAVKCVLAILLVIILLDVHPTYAKGGRGGGGRGGGRGSSSSGSRGSSSSSSSGSRGSSSSSSSSGRGHIDYSGTSRNNPSPPSPNIQVHPPVKPSAPELPSIKPSAPRLPGSPGQSLPSNNPYPYNPNYPQPGMPGPVVPSVNQPSYGSSVPGNPPPHGANQGYPPRGNPPPYSPRENPPPYSPQGNPPPYAPHGNPPAYPHQPQGNPPPYGVNTGVGYPRPPGGNVGSIHPGGQPPYSPYPRQPGFVYPPSYIPGAAQGGSIVKPHKKKGLLGGLLSGGKSHKKPKLHGIGSPVSSFGVPVTGHKISPVHMLLPAMAMGKTHKHFSRPKHHFWILPYAAHRSRFGGLDYDDDDIRRRCFTPRPPTNGTLDCNRIIHGVRCVATCQEGFTFEDNSTTKEAQCWSHSGHWSSSRFFPPCKPRCTECLNGGTCLAPGVCRCKAEYRGQHCEYHFMKCDIRKLASGSKIAWVCSHSRNETVCKVHCRPPLEFQSPPAEEYRCHINGTWTPDKIPACVEGGNISEGVHSVSVTTAP